MSRTILMVALALLTTPCVSLTSGAQAGTDARIDADGIQFSIELDKANFLPNDPIVLRLHFLNQSGQTLIVESAETAIGVGLDLDVISETGQPIPSKFKEAQRRAAESGGLFEVERPGSHFFGRVKSGEEWKGTLNLRRHYSLSSGAKYSIKATIQVKGVQGGYARISSNTIAFSIAGVPKGLKLVIESGAEEFAPGQAINLIAHLKNRSRQPLSPGGSVRGPFGHYTLDVVNEVGESLPFEDKRKKAIEADGNHLLLYGGGSEPLIIIQPGGEIRDILRDIDAYYSLLPGVTYSVTAKRSVKDSDGNWSEISSNTTKITVTN